MNRNPPTWDDVGQDDLLRFIEDRRVMPTVGPKLIEVRAEATSRLLHGGLADQLGAMRKTSGPQPSWLR